MQREHSLTRQVHDLIQGSDEWVAFRATHHGASEAAAMLGLSKKVKRSELIRMKATGLSKEFTAWVQEKILDQGHVVEWMARPLVEKIIGDDLYPVTCSLGAESASCDGLTMSEVIAFEHKQRNAELVASVAAGELPEEHAPQCQQVLMVTGAERLIFVVSDGTEEGMVWMWVYPDTAWFDRIIAGWEQFDLDVAAYVPEEIVEKPIAKVIMALPALVVQTRGEVVQSNLPQFQAAATAFIASIKTDLETDEDFVNADADIKFCQRAEDDLEHAKSAVMGQAVTIDEVMKTIDNIKGQLQGKRLSLSKSLDAKKLQIKEGILSAVKVAYAEHVAALEAEIKPLRLPVAAPDFAGAMKNKRTLASLKDAVDTLLANAKISTNATAADFRAKQAWCKENAAGHGALFMDMATIIAKPMDDFQLVVTTRVAAHVAAEVAKVEELRARVAAETKAQLEQKAAQANAERAANEQAAANLAKHTRETALAAAQQGIADQVAENVVADGRAAALLEQGRLVDLTNGQVAPAEELADAKELPEDAYLSPAAANLFAQEGAANFERAHTPPSLRLGQIGERLGFTVTADFVMSLGFAPAATDKAAKLYHEIDFSRICAAIQRHIGAVQAKHTA